MSFCSSHRPLAAALPALPAALLSPKAPAAPLNLTITSGRLLCSYLGSCLCEEEQTPSCSRPPLPCSRSPCGEKPRHPAAEPRGKRDDAELTPPRTLQGSRPWLSHCTPQYWCFAVTCSGSTCPSTGNVSAVTYVWVVPALHNPSGTAAGK